eukprot:TRINITY_DN6584_c0_g1_i2.p1 TRINITY_DN6584_c0_g1~~TRINITY_DN6584_c0_g1_i2.p1  ORF type:complete len:1254 (-),score=400.18 TRINITY_DN6584_c0_g1_i2:40-3801(-)
MPTIRRASDAQGPVLLLDFAKTLSPNTRSREEQQIIPQIEVIVKDAGQIQRLDELFTSLIEAILKRNPNHKNTTDSNGATLLHFACMLGMTQLAEALLAKGASTAIEDNVGSPPLAYAEKGNHEKIVRLLMEPKESGNPEEAGVPDSLKEVHKIKDLIQAKDVPGLERIITPQNVNVEDRTGTTPLQIAAFFGTIDGLKLLVGKGASVNSKDQENATVLHKAVIGGFLDCTKFLLDKGANQYVPDNDGLTPLHHACYYGKLELAKLLIDRGANLNAVDSEGSTPLHHAAASGQVELLDYLLQHKANPAAQDIKGATPLHIAAFENHAKCVSSLLKKSAELSTIKDKEDLTPIHHSCFLGFADITRLLLDTKKVMINDPDLTGSTPLHKACFCGHLECVKLLIANGATVDYDDGSTSPLHHAAYGGHTACIDILLKNGANVNCVDSERATPLHKAAYNGHIEAVKLLIANGADVLIHDEEGSTPLHKAAFSGQSKVLQVLLERGAEIDAEDNDDGTPLHNASFNGHLDCVKTLLANQANLNCADDKGASPLHLAVFNGHKDVAALLLSKGCPVDMMDDRGMTAMHHGIAHAHCLSFLLERGGEIDVKDNAGRTPLFYAAKNSCEEPARFLIIKGSDAWVRDKAGQSPMDVATNSFKKVISSALKEKEQQVDSETQKKYQSAVKLFNQKPKKGIEYLIENGTIEGLPQEIVKFLHTAENLDRKKIGELIGEGDAYNIRLLDMFTEYLDFTGLDFDDALRHFLSKFTLPGEAQKIDRIMERFAKQFVKGNPGVFPTEDTAYILAFSLIMLNTDLHSVHIKSKMTKEEFVRNNRGIAQGDSLPKGILESLYEKILKNEIKMEADSSAFASAEKKGWCRKQGGRVPTWKKRWFVLKNNCLYYFKKETDADPCGIIPLENLLVRTIENKGQNKYVFQLYSQAGEVKACKFEGGQLVKGHHDNYLISVKTSDEMESWIAAIRNNIAFNPIFEMIKKRVDQQGTPSRRGRNTEVALDARKLVDFHELNDACAMTSMTYKLAPAIRDAYGPGTLIIEDAERNVRHFMLTNDRGKSHTLVLGGSVSELPAGSNNRTKVDPMTAYGFDKALELITEAILKQVRKDYSITIFGHSFGGALAILIGSQIQFNATCKIDKVITFGQPKIIKDNQIASFKALPLTRILDFSDLIVSLFPGHVHVGPEIILFPEGYYATSFENVSDVVEKRTVDANHIESYIRNISKKQRGAIQIPFEDRQNFLAKLAN